MAALAMPLPHHAQRTARKRLLDELRRADNKRVAMERCADLLLSGDPALDTLTVFDLLKQCRRLGDGDARLLLAEAAIKDSSVRVGEILVRDAMRLAAVLRSGMVPRGQR